VIGESLTTEAISTAQYQHKIKEMKSARVQIESVIMYNNHCKKKKKSPFESYFLNKDLAVQNSGI
jgi:hypothetical protein